jgi:drug/metabolite transporter (DMT)-like permease
MHFSLKKVFNRLANNAYLLLPLAALFWAGNFVVGRGIHEQLPPATMAWIRWVLASSLFLPFALPHIKKDLATLRAGWFPLLLFGTIGVGCFNTLAYLGLNYTTALNGLVIQSAGPILIMIGGFILYRDQVSAKQSLGVLISLSGVLIVLSKADWNKLAALHLNSGDLWVLAAMGVWAIYTVLLRIRPDIHPYSFIGVTFIIGAIFNTPLMLIEFLWFRQPVVTTESLLSIAYISIFPSILSYLCWNKGVSLIGSSRAGVFLHMVPLFGSLLAILLLGEQPHLYHALGFALILGGVSLTAQSN